MVEYSKVLELAQTVRNDAAGLTDAVELWGSYRVHGLDDIKSRTWPAAKDFLDKYGEDKAQALFQTLDALSNLLFNLNPRSILNLGHGPGPSLGDETTIACCILSVFIPDIPDRVMDSLSGQYMASNR